MLLSRPLPLSSNAAGPRSRAVRVVVRDSRSELPFDASALVGEKLGRWLKTPVDLLAFGPRMGAGALVSTPMKLQTIQSDIERVMELIQDPRPINEKQEVLFKEVEDTMLEFLEKGTDVEQDVLTNLKTMLPAEAANMLSELIPEPPTKQSAIVVVPMESGEYTTYQKEDVAANQVQSEVTEIKNAVMALKAALEEIRSNTDPSQVNIVRLKLREARDLLARRLYEVSAEDYIIDSVAAATREAGILLDEVNAQFFSS